MVAYYSGPVAPTGFQIVLHHFIYIYIPTIRVIMLGLFSYVIKTLRYGVKPLKYVGENTNMFGNH